MASSRRKDSTAALTEVDIELIVNKAVAAAMEVIRNELGDRLTTLESRLTNLEGKFRSMEESFSATSDSITDFEARVGILEATVERMNTGDDEAVTLHSLQDMIRTNTVHSNDNEQYARRNNLRIRGLKAGSDGECAQAVVNFVCHNLSLKIDLDDIEAAHIVRKSTTNPASTSSTSAGNNVSHSTTSRVESTILVRFKSRPVRDEIIRRRKNLKASRYSIAEDLTTLNLQTMNRFNKKDCVKKTWSWNGKLFALLNNNTKILLRPFQALEDCTVCS